MDEVLKTLLENDLLNEETRTQLKEAFDQQINEAKEVARKEATEQVKAELTEQYIEDRDKLVEAIDTQIRQQLETDLEELREDIERFRDLEVEKEKEMAEYRQQVAEGVQTDMATLVEKLDGYLDIQIENQFEELRESIDEVRQQAWGKKIVEAFADEFQAMFHDDSEIKNELMETRKELKETLELLDATKQQSEKYKRDNVMESLLENLSGRPKEMMEIILKNVPTEKLEESYEKYIGRVIHEAEESHISEKENEVLAEGEEADDKSSDLNEDVQVVSGDNTVLKERQEEEDKALNESAEEKPYADTIAKMVKFATSKY